MGNPEAADSSDYQQNQADYNVQESDDDNGNDQAYYDLNPPCDGGDNNGLNPQYQQNDVANIQIQLQLQQQQFQPPQPQQQQPTYPATVAAAPQQYPPQQQPQYAKQSAPQVNPQNAPPPKPYLPSTAYQQQLAAQPVQFPPPAAGVLYAAEPPSPIKPIANNATVQGMQATMGSINTEGWTTGLFDCMDDPMNAAITFFFPCFTFGQVAEIIDNGTTTCATAGIIYALFSYLIGMPCIYSCTYRSKLRSKFGLVESPAPDWIVHFLFEPCALCQEYRELNRRGWDPAIGWVGSVQRQQQQMQRQQQAAMVPPMNQTMMD